MKTIGSSTVKCTVRAGIHSRPVGPVAPMCSENLWPRSWRLTSHKITQRHRNSVDPGGTVVDFQQPPRTLSISSTISAWLAKNPAFIRIEGKLLAYARPNTSAPTTPSSPPKTRRASSFSLNRFHVVACVLALVEKVANGRESLWRCQPDRESAANPSGCQVGCPPFLEAPKAQIINAFRRHTMHPACRWGAVEWFRPYSPHRSRRTGSRILDTRGLPQRTMVGMSKKLIEDRA